MRLAPIGVGESFVLLGGGRDMRLLLMVVSSFSDRI